MLMPLENGLGFHQVGRGIPSRAMLEAQAEATPHGAKIRVGECELLAVWIAECPKCNEQFRLLWPFWVLHIPLHRVVDLRCRFCQHSFSLVAISLTSCDGTEQLAARLVEGLS